MSLGFGHGGAVVEAAAFEPLGVRRGQLAPLDAGGQHQRLGVDLLAVAAAAQHLVGPFAAQLADLLRREDFDVEAAAPGSRRGARGRRPRGPTGSRDSSRCGSTCRPGRPARPVRSGSSSGLPTRRRPPPRGRPGRRRRWRSRRSACAGGGLQSQPLGELRRGRRVELFAAGQDDERQLLLMVLRPPPPAASPRRRARRRGRCRAPGCARGNRADRAIRASSGCR